MKVMLDQSSYKTSKTTDAHSQIIDNIGTKCNNSKSQASEKSLQLTHKLSKLTQ